MDTNNAENARNNICSWKLILITVLWAAIEVWVGVYNLQRSHHDDEEVGMVKTFMMKQTLDWIGTTETLSNETLPLLNKMLGHEESSQSVRNKSARYPFEDAMNEEALTKLHNINFLDHKLYSDVVNDYVFSEMYPELVL